MTQQEFETRVKMTVSSDEYQAIETVYMASDLNKDDFCYYWSKMNKTRIAAFKKEQSELESMRRTKERAHEIYDMLQSLRYELSDSLAVNKLSKSNQKFLESIGIEMQGQRYYEPFKHFKTVFDVRSELRAYLAI